MAIWDNWDNISRFIICIMWFSVISMEYLIMKQLEINWHAATISKRGIEFSEWTFFIDTQEKNVFGGQMWPNNSNDSCSVQTVTYFPVKIEVPAKINLQSSEYSKVNQFSRTVWSRQINGTARVKFEWCDPWNLFRLLYSTIFSIAKSYSIIIFHFISRKYQGILL